MRVISQDENHSIQFERCHIWKQETQIFTATEKGTVLLGHYDTAERASEVFGALSTGSFLNKTFYMPQK